MIELAARCWKMELGPTLNRLYDLGFAIPPVRVDPEPRNRVERTLYDTQRWLKAMQTRSAAALADCEPAAMEHAGPLGLRQDLDATYWRQRFRDAVGALPIKEVVRLWMPQRTDRSDGIRGLFRTNEPGNTVCIPFQDMPGRITGILFSGKTTQFRSAFFVHATQYAASAGMPGKLLEGGVCLLDALVRPSAFQSWFKSTCFVLDQPLLALRLQSKHLRDNAQMLPLVGAHPCTMRVREEKRPLRYYRVLPRAVWRLNAHRDYIFRGDTLTPDLVSMAIACNGRISLTCYREPEDYPSPERWLLRVADMAVPWQIALENHVKTLDSRALGAFLTQLEATPETLRDFLHGCSASVQEAVKADTAALEQQKTVTVRGRPIYEDERGWCFGDVAGGDVLSSATVRIDQVLHQPGAGATYYRGQVTHKGQTVPFIENAKLMQADPLAWLRDTVEHAGLGMVLCDGAWSKALLEIARKFNDPTPVTIADKYGWDSRTGDFILPRFRIMLGGKVDGDCIPLFDYDAPAQRLDQPSDLNPPDLIAMTEDTPSNRLLWAVTACIIANLTAAPAGHTLAGIGLVGDGVQATGLRMAEKLGCSTYRPPADASSHAIISAMESRIGRHDWPVVCDIKRVNSFALQLWLSSDMPRNAMLATTPMLADALPLLGGWRIISGPDLLPFSADMLAGAQRILPAWLQRFSSQKFEFASNSIKVLDRILDDLGIWVRLGAGNPYTVSAAREWILDEGQRDPAVSLIRVLHRFMDRGELVLEREGFPVKTKQSKIYHLVDTAPGGLFLSQPNLNRLTSHALLPLLPSDRITQAIGASGGLLETRHYEDEYGWLISEAWWNKQIAACRKERQRVRT